MLQREVGVFVTNRAKEADALEKARDAEADPAKRAELDQQLVDAQKWGPGGEYGRIVTAITAAAGGNVTGGMGDLVTKATINYIQSLGVEQVKAIADGLKSETARAALQGIVGCAGAAASGGDCGAGALGGSASVVLNNLLDKAGGKSGEDLSQEEKQARANLVTSVVAGIAGATGTDVATASTGAKIETENNALNLGEFKSLIQEARGCEKTNSCESVRDRYRNLSRENQEKVVATCATDPQACQGEFSNYLAELGDFRKALDAAVGEKLPSEVKNDLGIYLLHYNDAVGAVNEPEFAKQLQEKFGVTQEVAQTAAAVAAAAAAGTKGRGKYIPNAGAVNNMGEFMKQPGFGSQIKTSVRKTNYQYQGQSVYKVSNDFGDTVQKGDLVCLDGAHKNHLEVFDSTGNFKAAINLDGTPNDDKTKAGKAQGRKLKLR
ncbi:tRNA nuclease CdiA-2 [Pandoraea terrae]|uniref:tRNA nuclease CdiA-2 n=1 Tax=Pandoraea terrae TaxID=1537710 RepID=A0A5E4ZD15_9BURK|nr:tRNA nuclease CdiA-2 [Pandoraea terrae]